MAWDDVLMVGATAASAFAAFKAVGHSRRATAAAAGAVLEAKDANSQAKEAHKTAKEANQISMQSNDVALQGNEISARAAADARDLPKIVAWEAYIIAISALQTFDPTSQNVGDRLIELRTRAVLLVDLLDADAFGRWLAAEQTAIVLLMHEAMLKGQDVRDRLGRHPTVEEVLAFTKPFHTRVAGLTINVRFSRRKGLDSVAYDVLEAKARESIEQTAARNGWEVPPDTIEGLEPLDLDPDVG